MSSYREPRVGQTLPASFLADFGLRGTWTPALTATTTNPNLGSGPTQTGTYTLLNGVVTGVIIIAFGTGGSVAAGSGTYLISLPSGLGIHTDYSDQIPVGPARIRDASGATVAYDWRLATDATQPDKFVLRNDTGGAVTNSVPWTWAASDSIRATFKYMTDFT